MSFQREYDPYADPCFGLRSTYGWTMDPVLWHNQQTMLFYKGVDGEGEFIQIDAKGNVEIGAYQYALPHITDGDFKAYQHILCPTQEYAFKLISDSNVNLLRAKVKAEAILATVQR